ncbi:MAG: Flp pilus assembly complex ATPase component TadA, partial [Parasporobacterium sp.]|nr:Flp pilus assembly complex ATPase component TadA [Parasporobacterium sp.]
VIQREISVDTDSFLSGLRASLRESPDVLLLGEVRDSETMEVVMTAAETGQLIFSSMHTLSAADTVDRIVDSFPEKKQPQVRAQLARVLRCVVCQKLIPTSDGKLVPVFEVMYVTPAIQNLIREGKTYQFASIIQEGEDSRMVSMNTSLLRLVKEGKISKETALEYSENRAQLTRKLAAEGLA